MDFNDWFALLVIAFFLFTKSGRIILATVLVLVFFFLSVSRAIG